MTAAIAANGLSKRYRIGELQSSYGTLRESLARAAKQIARGPHRHHHEEIWALHDVSFDVPEGQVLGVIGGNGAGKSTLLKILTRITAPTSGRAEIRGRVGSLLEVGTGFHPELTGRENVFLNGSVLGMKRREISRKLDEIVDFAGVERFIDTPVKRYSSGMYVRLAFAVAAHLEPEILLVDEVLAVGDAEFQRRCLGRMEDFGHSGRTVLFVSHNMQAIGRLCERTLLLEGGRIAQDGRSADVVAQYLQSGRGSGSYREWTEEDPIWSDGTVQLRWIKIVQDGRVVESADVRRPIGIELAFDVLDDRHAVFPKIKVNSAEGEIVFNAFDTDPRWHEPAAPGPYVSTAWIPANLLNEGLFTVDPAVTSLGTGKLLPHTGERQSVSFHVHDTGEGDSARGNYSGQLRGTVRPLLEVDHGGTLTQIVGVILVRNEDLFVERAIRSVVEFCDCIHALDHVSTDNTWEILRALAREYDHVEVRRTTHAGDSQRILDPYAGTDTWVFGVDGDELYDAERLRGFRSELLGSAYRDVFKIGYNMLNCVAIDWEARTASGYLSPPSRLARKLFNFAAIESWESDGAERLHGGIVTFRPGYGHDSVDNLGDRLSWNETPLRCLHTTFLRRSSGDPEHDDPILRPILMESAMQDRSWRGDLKRFVRGRRPPEVSEWKPQKYMRGDLVTVDATPFFPVS